MLCKMAAMFMVCLMLSTAGTRVVPAVDSTERNLTKSEKKIKKRAAKIKAAVNKLGVGKDSLVIVKLRDKTKVKGYISNIEDGSFTVIDTAGETQVIEYSKAKQIQGNNLHSGVWVAIGVGIGVIIFWIIFRQFDS